MLPQGPWLDWVLWERAGLHLSRYIARDLVQTRNGAASELCSQNHVSSVHGSPSRRVPWSWGGWVMQLAGCGDCRKKCWWCMRFWGTWVGQHEARPTQDGAHAETWAWSSFLGVLGETVSQGSRSSAEELPLMALGSFPCGLGCFWMVEVGTRTWQMRGKGIQRLRGQNWGGGRAPTVGGPSHTTEGGALGLVHASCVLWTLFFS